MTKITSFVTEIPMTIPNVDNLVQVEVRSDVTMGLIIEIPVEKIIDGEVVTVDTKAIPIIPVKVSDATTS